MTVIEYHMSIQEVSDRLSLPKSTIRFWEKRFAGFIAPTRTAGGQRRYTQHDVKIMTSICKHKKLGYSLTQIKAHLMQSRRNVESLNPEEIDLLAERISATVRREIYHYFDHGRNAFEVNTGEGRHKKR